MTDETTELEPLQKSIVIDRLLLRNARKTYKEISELTGIPTDEVAERLMMLLDETPLRDDLIEEKLLLHELGELVETTRDRLTTATKDEDFGSIVRAQTATIKLLLEQIDKRRKAIDVDLATLNEAQARHVATAFGVAMELVLLKLEEQLPDTDKEVIRVTFREVLPDAIERVEAVGS